MQGYKNLCKLSSIGYLEGFYYSPRIDLETLNHYKEGLICLSGCISSMVSQEILSGTKESVIEKIRIFQQLFGDDFYLEIMRHEMSPEHVESDNIHQESWLLQYYQDYLIKQNKINENLVQLSHELNIPLVATNDIHYIDRDDWRAHEIILNVQSGEPTEIWEKDSMGNPNSAFPTQEEEHTLPMSAILKLQDQMAEMFKDIPEAIINTLLSRKSVP